MRKGEENMIDFSEVKLVSIDKLEKEVVKRVSNFFVQ